MNTNELEQYKRELITEHKAEIAAIDRLIGREKSKVSANGHTDAYATTVRVRRRQSAASIVKEAAMKLSGDFTRENVEKKIAEIDGNCSVERAVVTVELWKLARGGVLKTVSEGRGKRPAIYRRV